MERNLIESRIILCHVKVFSFQIEESQGLTKCSVDYLILVSLAFMNEVTIITNAVDKKRCFCISHWLHCSKVQHELVTRPGFAQAGK